jgi:hypothetical protein
MIREANRRGQGLVPPGGLGDPGLGPSGKVLPQLRVSEVLDIPPPGERSSALRALEQDFKKIDEDIERSEFRFGDPSTWFDTKTDDAKNEARDRYKEAAERYRDLLSDDLSTDDQRRAAAEELLRARNDFDLARGIVERQAASADYLTPVTELVQLGQDALHDQGEKQRQLLVDRLTEAGLPPALVGLVTLPGELTDNTADALAGLLKSPVYVADDIAGMIAHPVDTVTGLLQLGLRIEDATYSGRAFRFLLEAATGKYDSLDEAEEAFLDQMNPLSLLDAQSQLVLDLGRGALGQSIDLAKEGKWAEAMGTLVGTNVNWGAAIGGLRGVRRLRAAIEAEAEIQKAARAATEGTQAAREAGTLGPKSVVPGSPEHKAARWLEYQARGGEWSYERWSKTYDRNMVRATQANAAVDDFWRQLGWGKREVVVDVEGVPRKLDIGDVQARRGVEYKTGYQTATQETLWEITRDQILIEQGWSIRWHFKGTVSEPLLKALRDAGIPYTVGK